MPIGRSIKQRLVDEMLMIRECRPEEYRQELDLDDLYDLLETALNRIDTLEKGVTEHVDRRPAA